MRLVSTEQGSRLAALLVEHDIAHGDVAHDVELAHIGVKQQTDGPRLAFCPVAVARLGNVKRADAAERKVPMPLEVHLSNAAHRKITRAANGRNGFLSIRARIWGNGRLNVENITVTSFERVPFGTRVSHAAAYEEYCQAAKS